ncbi:MAG TPA: hypothetical protein VMB18_18410 [Terriglobales bacterium]|nr:hypothetical protein [Terriglobales bacterium]
MVPPAGSSRNRGKGKGAAASEGANPQRTRNRQKAVLPVRISGVDVDGKAYTELVHTLDITDTGVRLGSVRCNLHEGSVLTLQYKQHKAEFRVAWITKRPCGKEFQVGLQALVERDLWGLEAEFKIKVEPTPPVAVPSPT